MAEVRACRRSRTFEKLVEPYRREILVRCYRILGSFEDAEDISQEILLRVWKRLAATKACLDELDSRGARWIRDAGKWSAAEAAMIPLSLQEIVNAAQSSGNHVAKRRQG